MTPFKTTYDQNMRAKAKIGGTPDEVLHGPYKEYMGALGTIADLIAERGKRTKKKMFEVNHEVFTVREYFIAGVADDIPLETVIKDARNAVGLNQ